MSTIEERDQDLLPGIPDEITLDFIAPKLPWKAFHVLSSVGRAWRRAIQSRKVYNARVRCQATEAGVVIYYLDTLDGKVRAIGLYSVRDKSVSLLPSIPNVPNGLPFSSQSVAIDGRIYVLGSVLGREWADDSYDPVPHNELYVMDLAGQRQWEQCKSMASGSWNFALGVMGGKIYVFVGYSPEGRPVPKSEVYDPQSNSWDPIKSMMPLRCHPQVAVIGEELFLHGGHTSDGKSSNLIQAYHPHKDEWREVTQFGQDFGGYQGDLWESRSVFTLQGQLHCMTRKGIDVYDMEKKLWTPRHPFSSLEVTRALYYLPWRWATLDADNELVTVIRSFSPDRGGDLLHCSGSDLRCSVGFGGQQETVAWQKVECSHKLGLFPSIFSIRL